MNQGQMLFEMVLGPHSFITWTAMKVWIIDIWFHICIAGLERHLMNMDQMLLVGWFTAVEPVACLTVMIRV